MPELPDITIYVEALERRVVGQSLVRVRLVSPFVLRTAVPPIGAAEGRRVTGVRRLGKRVVLALDGGLFLVMHLMVAGRLRWVPSGARLPGRITLAALDFPDGSVVFTEAGTKKRASLHLLADEATLSAMNPGGLEPLDADPAAFAARLAAENHTLKRALTDPHLFSGIGNAYSDEILHRARLSPLTLTQKLTPEEVSRVHRATVEVLTEWSGRLRAQAGDAFPENVTAFRPEMAVHGKFGKPCPVCGAPVQRIRYAENETNYCARCQTGGVVLADRALSRLLRKSWPRNIDELG
ncbi:MAG: DNA-formamidopyrimidine glycosylase family protein [Burkholderiales bacterium]